jgi:RNA polymerase sigma factor for flagellar operon FliA
MTAVSLFARCKSGDTDARNELLRMHVGIVHFVARRLARSLADAADLDELVSAGHIGLMAAVENFDEARGLAFTTFAATRVRGAILDELRRQDRVPRSVRAKARTLHAVRDRLGNELGRTPTQREVALAAALPLDTLWQWQHDIDRAGQVSLDAPVGTRNDDGRTLGERVEEHAVCPSMRLEHEETRDLIRGALDELGETERRVVSLYFFEEKTLQEIAPHLGVSESRVSQIRTRALRRLRDRLTSRGISTADAA